MPARLVEEAEALLAWLVPSQTGPVLLHGDLHHGNVLSARRRPWLAIDPKGVVGERAFDAGALLYNPRLSRSVLAAYWSWEDGGEMWEEALAFAEMLAAIGV